MRDEARAIYDTTFSNMSSAVAKVEMALKYGTVVNIIYVFRPFEAAVKGAIERAVDKGRVVPLSILAKDHVEAPKTVLGVAKQYMSEPRVVVTGINNSGLTATEAEVIAQEDLLPFLEKLTYGTYEEFLDRAKKVLTDEQERSEIPAYIFRAFERDNTKRAGE